MTRKDFVTVARTIASLDENTTREEVAKKFTDVLAGFSPFFDGAKFLGVATGADETEA